MFADFWSHDCWGLVYLKLPAFVSFVILCHVAAL